MSVIRGTCLCGAVAWDVDGPLGMMSHCHCSRCRKSHGTPFATYAMAPVGAVRLRSGADAVVRFASTSFERPFCGRCGSVVVDPDTPVQGMVGIPTGPLDDDPGARSLAHIFVGSKAPWYAITDALPRFETWPPGVDLPVAAPLPERDPPGGPPRGSCLCGGVAYVVEGAPARAVNCHCARCRKARAAAYAANLVTSADGVRFTRGTERLASWKVPEARFFTQVFCRTCGSPMPRADRERDLAVVPMGTLDDDPGMRPQRHIFVGSKAPWYDVTDDLPQHEEYPPAA